MKLSEAARTWQHEFNTFPLGMIQKLYDVDPSDWCEVTPIAEDDQVWSNEYQSYGRVLEITDEIATVELYDDEKMVEVELDDLSREDDGYFPMWGWMWQFNDSGDDWWLTENLQAMANCGFRIYCSDEFGYFFGIDGAGYDFYEAHWIPLYKARGLRWHDEGE